MPLNDSSESSPPAEPLRIFLIGATASGKSAVGMQLARQLGGEIFCMDAFQVYKELEIGTGKPTVAERREVPHYLLDLAEPLEPFNVARYLECAEEALKGLNDPSRIQIWVGGTGFYFRALRDGLAPAPETEPEVLKELEDWSLERLQRTVNELDPAWAAEADLNNHRRIQRALAVVLQTGRPLSDWHSEPRNPLLKSGIAFYLHYPLDDLRIKIRKRVNEMWEAGWPQEVEALMKDPEWLRSQSAGALGYREVASYLQQLNSSSGSLVMTKDEVIEQICLQTAQYARRQNTWFRKEKTLNTIYELTCQPDTTASLLAENIIRQVQESTI